MKKKLLGLFCFWVAALTSACPAVADIYPGYLQIGSGNIQEPETPGNSREGLINTLLSKLLTGPVGEDFTVEIQSEKSKRVFHLQLKHQHQKEKAHLVVVIPGFGASRKKGTAPFLSELLNREGMVTLSTDSPANPEFIKNSSSLAVPGIQKWDAQDLYDMMRAAKKKLEEDFQYKFSKVSVIGASLGSMNAFHVGALDRNKSKDPIHFYRVVSLNPPISNVWGTTIIDTFVAQSMAGGADFDTEVMLDSFKNIIQDMGFQTVRGKVNHNYEEVGTVSLEIQKKLKKGDISQKNLKFLVGFGFAPIISEAIKAGKSRFAQDIADTQISTQRISPVQFFTEFLRKESFKTFIAHRFGSSLRHAESLKDIFSFDEWKFPHFDVTEKESLGHLVPKWQKEGHDLSNFHLITWQDDFLLRKKDPKWIEETLTGKEMGTGKVFYKSGGHLGGYWQKDFQTYLKKIMK